MKTLFGVVALSCCLSTVALAKDLGQPSGTVGCNSGLFAVDSGMNVQGGSWCGSSSQEYSLGTFPATPGQVWNGSATWSTGAFIDGGCNAALVEVSNGTGELCTAGHKQTMGFSSIAEGPCTSNADCAGSPTYEFDAGHDFGYTMVCNLEGHIATHALANTCEYVGDAGCNENNDCGTGLCTAGFCIPSPNSDSVLAPPNITHCIDTKDCLFGSACVEGYCKCVPTGQTPTNGADCCTGTTTSGACSCLGTGHQFTEESGTGEWRQLCCTGYANVIATDQNTETDTWECSTAGTGFFSCLTGAECTSGVCNTATWTCE